MQRRRSRLYPVPHLFMIASVALLAIATAAAAASAEVVEDSSSPRGSGEVPWYLDVELDGCLVMDAVAVAGPCFGGCTIGSADLVTARTGRC